MDMREIISSFKNNLELNPWEFVVSPFNECFTGEIESIESSPAICSYNDELFEEELINFDGSSDYAADNEDNEFNEEGDEFSEEDDENNTPTVAVCIVYVKEQEVIAVADNSLAVNVITTPLIDQLNYHIDEPSDIPIITLGDNSVRPIGIITEFPIHTSNMLMLTPVYVLSSTDPILILGNNWIHETEILFKKKEREITGYIFTVF